MLPKLSVFGLGKLGCTMLACFAHKGWDVIGMDINEEFVSKVNNGESPIFEPGVDGLIKDNKDRISATLSAEEAIMQTDVSFIIVPTPSLPDGSFSTKYVEAVCAEIGSILSLKKNYHLVVVTSTVLPGDMQIIVNLLEKTSRKKVNKDFGLCYNPDFIALGSVVFNFLNPDMVLIGESDKKAGDILENIHRQLVDSIPNIHRMNFYNAELSKIALNSYCTMKITFANSLAEFCEKLPGGDVDVVTNAIGDDLRIGRKYLKGGLSYGGPCFPRDNRAIADAAARFGVEFRQARLNDELNNYFRSIRIPNILIGFLKEKKSKDISILGLSYKTDTTLVEESASIHIIKSLARAGMNIKIYDPAGMNDAKSELYQFDNIYYSESAADCLKNSAVCLIATPWNEFRMLTKGDFINAMKPEPVIYDAWNLYDDSFSDCIIYKKIGKS